MKTYESSRKCPTDALTKGKILIYMERIPTFTKWNYFIIIQFISTYNSFFEYLSAFSATVQNIIFLSWIFFNKKFWNKTADNAISKCYNGYVEAEICYVICAFECEWSTPDKMDFSHVQLSANARIKISSVVLYRAIQERVRDKEMPQRRTIRATPSSFHLFQSCLSPL